MLNKREDFLTEIVLPYELILLAHNTRLPRVRYDTLPQGNEKFPK